MTDALVAELEPYFRSGNEIPVARATIPTDLAERILSALRSQQEEIARLTARADYLQEKVDIDSKFIHETVIELDKAKTDLATARRDALTEAAALMRGNRYLSGGPGPLFAAGWNAACNNSAGLVEKLRDDPPGQANGAEGKV